MDVLCFFIMPILWFGSSVAAVIYAIKWFLKAISCKETKLVKKKFFISLGIAFCLLVMIGAFFPGDEDESENTSVIEATQDDEESTYGVETETAEPMVALAFLDDFREYGYTKEQIHAMREILVNVGVTEITDLEITPVSYGMQGVKGVAFRYYDLGWDKEVHVQFNIENGVLYFVHIYCPSYGTSNQPTYLSGLEDRHAELYYDTEGGYLKRIDWKNKAVVDY